MALAKTLTKPADVKHRVEGNKDVRFYDLTTDTGTYGSGGITITAAEVGLKHVDYVGVSGGIATCGTAGANGVGIGITYATGGTSFVVWVYEAAASAAPFIQKDNAEAMLANFTIRLKIEGY